MAQKFLRCEKCGNIVGMVNDSGVTPVCCGQKMTVLEPNSTDASAEKHLPEIKIDGDTVTVTVSKDEHPMAEDHYIMWISLRTNEGNQRKILKPGDKPVAVFKIKDGEKVEAAYEYCNKHGLWKTEVQKLVRGIYLQVKRILKLLGAAFAVHTVAGIVKKDDSVYDNAPSERNPHEGKQVVFIESEEDPINADGVRGHLEDIGDTEHNPTFYESTIKRIIDIILSFFGLIILSPALIILSLWIVIDDPGPILFTQKRVGKDKQFFKLHKFRSMKMNTPHDKPTHMLDNPDKYITNAGRFMRKHSLDELPQIWDIFIGNMSVIGPRPALWNQDLLTSERDKYGANDIKPGLTGWAQINGRDELEIPVKAKLDGEYAQALENNQGIIMDNKCFLGSLGVFKGDESVVEGGTGEMKKQERA